MAPMVRVPRGEYHFLARALDVGAQGVMVPMVESVEQARAVAEATHYPPKAGAAPPSASRTTTTSQAIPPPR